MKSTKLSNGIIAPANIKYMEYVEEIFLNENFLKMNEFIQHGNTTCLEHSINVSIMAYRLCEKWGLNSKAAARAGLLHDMFLYDWHDKSRGIKKYYHGLSHPREALINARIEFQLNDIEANSILRHMWPLTIVPPKYKEGFVILLCDKVCSVLETFGKKVW